MVVAEEIRDDVKAISETIDRLAERAAREIREVKVEMGTAVVEAEETLRRAVEEARARLAVIEAKHKLAMARLAVVGNNLVDAESLVEAAMSHLSAARSLSGKHAESRAAI